MAKSVIHVSEEEAASDFASLMASIRAGAEVIIEENARPIAILRPGEASVRLLSESLRLARERGSSATLDDGFSKDLKAVVESHRRFH
jgi:antitoxin (DNA-binding transcriptional repressor) of toxin-antitoxin stability system